MKRKERFAKYRREKQIERVSMQNKPQQRKSPINRVNVQPSQKNEQPAERNDQQPNVIVVQVNVTS